MLEFINANGILFSGIISIITALIAAFATHIIEGKREKKETIKALQGEVSKLQANLKRYESQEAADKAIDKSDGSLYVETLPDGKKRTICGFCWEDSYHKTPLVPEWYYERHERYEVCRCPMCERYCRGLNVPPESPSETIAVEPEDLPF